MASRRGIQLIIVFAAVVAVAAALGPPHAAAQDTVTVTGVLDYEALPPGQIVESISGNTVELTFDPSGGPFSGTAVLNLTHDVPERGCQFTSTHRWEFSGDFEADTGQFTGEYQEVEEATIGACENFSFTRTFDPDQAAFNPVLIRQLGEIRHQIPPVEFTLLVDPALFPVEETPAPTTGGTTEDPTTSEPVTTPTAGDEQSPPPITTDPADAGQATGIPPWLLFGLPALLVAGAALWWWQQQGTRGSERPDEKDRDCSRLEEAWRRAQDACNRAETEADDLSTRLDDLDRRVGTAQDALAGLPSETTRVELPDGTSLSQLDLELRRTAAAAAWDSYLADPTPANAAAAEEAWNEQATPEWLAEQRRAHQAAKDRLEAELETARRAREQTRSDLAGARSRQRELCTEAAEARRRLDECLKQVSAQTPAAPAAPEPAQPEPPSSEPRAPEPQPLPVGFGGSPPGGPDPGDVDENRGCRDGDLRWIMFDGPHPFAIPTDELVKVTVVLIAGTDRRPRLGSLDRAEFTNLGPRGEAVAIPFSYFINLTDEEIRAAFSGPAGLAEIWASGSGGDQRFTITLSFGQRSVMATCERKERCVDGQWQREAEWRARTPGDVETVRKQVTVLGNIQPGLGRTEEDMLAELVAFVRAVQIPVRQMLSSKETYEDYVDDCRTGKRP